MLVAYDLANAVTREIIAKSAPTTIMCSMPATPPPPLSSTVATVFAEFVKKLEGEKTLDKTAIDALRLSLEQQKLDPESLRKALFASAETAK